MGDEGGSWWGREMGYVVRGLRGMAAAQHRSRVVTAQADEGWPTVRGNAQGTLRNLLPAASFSPVNAFEHLNLDAVYFIGLL